MIYNISLYIWFAFMTWLSHQPGNISAEQSGWISKMLHVKHSTLRVFAHVLCFSGLIFLTLGSTDFTAGIVFSALWAVFDEITKPISQGRHCHFADILWNYTGCLMGFGVYKLLH